LLVRRNKSNRENRARRTPRPLIFAAVGLIAIFLVAAALVRYFSSPGYIEKRIVALVGPRYLVDIESSHYDPLRKAFVATGISIVSDTLWAPAKPRDTRRTRRSTSFKASGVHANGLSLVALLKGDLVVDELQVDSPRYRLMMDRGVPSKRIDKPRMPHIVLASSDSRIRIGEIRIVDADIRYSERARDGNRPGTFRFADLYATISNLTNDPKRMAEPCVIDVRTRLANSGPLKATFEYDLSSPELKMTYRASIGKMDALALNDLLVNLNGIQITSGTIDATTLDIKIDGDVATGTMKLLYHGLEFEIQDKNSEEQGIGDHVASFLQKSKTRESNPDDDDEPAAVITLRRERAPAISLIKFVWETAREGALRTIGVQ
jgi:hypothetical protein